MDSPDILGIVVTAFLVIAVLAGGGVFLWFTQAARRQDQRAWVARLVRAEDAKYGILAREIHDAYVPTLMGTAMQWQGRAPAEMISAIQKVASDLRSLSHSLHPNSIDSIGLVGALEDLVSPWKEAPSLSKCTLTVVGQCRMSPECALACYRIAQAALSNARIHAGKAARVEVSLIEGPEHVTLKVRDDGGGFDRLRTQLGLGLRSMQERAEAVSGTFSVKSRIGEGTVVSVCVPRLREKQ